MKKLSTRISIAALGLVGTTGGAFAQDVAVAVPTDSVFILNSLLFLIGGFLVFWMAAGFAMLEAGLVRSKNVTMQLTKNMALFSLAAVFYYLIGYNLMYPLGTWSVDGIYLASLDQRSLRRLALARMALTIMDMRQRVQTSFSR